MHVVYDPDDPLLTEDGDFEPTAEMLIHDTMDDETTLAEEEALRTQEEDEAELNELQEVCSHCRVIWDGCLATPPEFS